MMTLNESLRVPLEHAQALLRGEFIHETYQNFFDVATVFVITALVVGYLSWLGLYRLFFSPLASIPGPKLAAITYWYEIYYDVWLSGQYFRKIAEMHERYGPIVRINPHEVHFNDPEFIDPLFPGPSRKTDKYMFTGRRTGTQNSIVATVDHDMHRMRRNTINGFFSTASIRRLEPIMQESMASLLRRLEEAGKTQQVLPMHYVLKACTSDVITKYAFGDSFHFMEEKDYAQPYMEATDVYHLFNHAFCHFPWVGTLIANAPTWAIKTFIPSLTAMWDKRGLWMEQVVSIKTSPNPERAKSTIFEGILSSNKLPEEEKSNDRMAHEAQLVVFAGQGTTAYTLSAALYQLLANPEILRRAKAELAEAIPQAGQIPAFAQLENLPYFGAVVQEVLRVHPGIVSRLPRVSPEIPIEYINKRNGKRYVIPAGTPTNMTIQIAHMNPEAFEDPYTFRPERWLENPRLDRAFIGFARGTRNCIGMNFARREVFIILATIIRKYDLYRGQEGPTMELYDTTRERDIDVNRDMIIPFAAAGSHGLRVRVRN
ncbi:N-acetyltryptophan 6-hydroxylase ivoC [Paramyrothecium foliicola]|nr:N-acetyltryptophan 6-hydroxylase ivoC [Paramyrothecium foliicola]